MKYLQYMVNRQPLASVLVVIVMTAVILFSFFALCASLLESQSRAQACAMFLTGLVLLFVLVRSGASREAGIGLPSREHGRHWWVVTMVMAVLGLTAFLLESVDMSALVFSAVHAAEWLLTNMATGFLEELWFRGICFYLLYRAWGSTRQGVFKAAAVQALLFGALHMGNLHRSDLISVLLQTGWSTFIGFGFAGLVAYSHSIWPVVALHVCFNASTSVDNFFAGPAYSFPELSVDVMLIRGVVSFVVIALPGVWCLKRAPLLMGVRRS